VIEQLKQQLFANNKNGEENQKKSNLLLPPSFLDLAIVPKQSHREKSNIIPSSLKEPQISAETKTVHDFQKELR
jgi:hypothetical protein